MNRIEFTLSGEKFSAPEKIGAGTFARIAEYQTVQFRAIGAATHEIVQSRHALTEKLRDEYPYAFILSTLQGLLRPESGVAVEDAYESASPDEVQKVVDFFSESTTGKTATAPNKRRGSNGTRGTRKRKA